MFFQLKFLCWWFGFVWLVAFFFFFKFRNCPRTLLLVITPFGVTGRRSFLMRPSVLVLTVLNPRSHELKNERMKIAKMVIKNLLLYLDCQRRTVWSITCNAWKTGLAVTSSKMKMLNFNALALCALFTSEAASTPAVHVLPCFDLGILLTNL